MHTLIIRHLGSEGDQHRCQVWRPDGKSAEEAVIMAPEALQVEGRPNSNLSRNLRWYLEEFLDYPFPPMTEVAERVQVALKTWGNRLLWRCSTADVGAIFTTTPTALAWNT